LGFFESKYDFLDFALENKFTNSNSQLAINQEQLNYAIYSSN